MADRLYADMTFEQTVRKYAQSVHTVCIVRLRNTADADDCFQNTFIKLFTKAPRFTDENHLKAWLLRVAINECRSFARKNRSHISLDRVEDIPLPLTDDESDISWALIRLEPKYREALYLYYGEGYSSDEIAGILGVKPGTVRSLLSRGRVKLKEIYGGDE